MIYNVDNDLKNKLDYLKENYTDKVDMSVATSLLEYGFIRNPDNDKVLHSMMVGNYDNPSYRYAINYVSKEDVRDALYEDCDNAFFEYCDTSFNKMIDELTHNNLAHTMLSLRQYYGFFRPHHFVSKFADIIDNI